MSERVCKRWSVPNMGDYDAEPGQGRDKYYAGTITVVEYKGGFSLDWTAYEGGSVSIEIGNRKDLLALRGTIDRARAGVM